MKLENLNISKVEYDLENGFFWVEFDNDKSIQCCLIERKDGKGFRKAIDMNDNGYDWGMCEDVNRWAFNENGEGDHVLVFLLKQARKAGLQIV